MEIIHDLLIQCNSDQTEIISQAEQAIQKMREENKNSFLQMLSFFLANNDHSSTTYDTLALILAHQTIPFSINRKSILDDFDSELIKNLLDISSSFFSSDDFSLRSSAAILFSKILLNDQISENKFDTIQFLLNLFMHPSSPIIIQPLSLIIYDYCYYYSIKSSIILAILDSLTFFFQAESTEVDCCCLKIISILIPSMGEIMATELEKLFPLLLNYSQNPLTMPKAFECFTVIAKNFYPYLANFLPIITSSDFLDLILISEGTEDSEEIINSYLSFWKSISKIEINFENDQYSLNIIENTFLQLIPIFLKIESSSQSEEIDVNSNEPSVKASQVLDLILSKYIDQSLPILESFINDFQSSESFGERETSLSCVFFLIRYLDNENIDEYFRLIKNGLSDEVPRVRQNAIYCSQAFCDTYKTSNPQSIEIMQDVITKISEDEYTASDAATVIRSFFTIDDFPFFEESMITLIEFSSTSNLEDSETAFKSLEILIKCSTVENRHNLLNLLLQLFESCSSFNEFHLSKLIDLLTELIYRLRDQIDDKFDTIWELLSSGAAKLPFLFLIPISAMSISSKVKFSPYIESTLTLINEALNSEHYEMACSGLKIMVKSTDLTDFSPLFLSILESLMRLLENEEIPARNKRMIVEVFDTINREIPSLFDSVLNTAFPTIARLSFDLDDWEDFDSNSDFLRFFSEILSAEEGAASEAKEEACKSVLHIMSLVVDCPKMDEYYIDSVIDALYSVACTFPDMICQFYEQNLALELTLKYAMSVEGTDLKKIGCIFDVINS